MKKQFYRVKQLADQTFSRSGKGEALSDELLLADRKVEHLRNALQLVSKRLSTGAGSTLGQDPAAREKRLKKIPEYMLGLSMTEASNFDDEASILKFILYECGNTEKFLANEMVEHELKVEDMVCTPLSAISEQDVPAIMKAKKHLSRMINEKESAANRYHHLERQIEQNPSKLIAARDELEESANKVDAARDSLAADMFTLVAKETQLAHTLLQYVKLQRAYHESALHFLQDTVPELERIINNSAVKPVFGYPLEEHLRVTGRTIALPIEICVCMLHELGLNEEGVFRITGSATKVRRMKLSLNAGLFTVPLPREYRDLHVVAAVLKSYLRDLPEPLLTFSLYDSFIAASQQNSVQEKLNSIWEAIHLLPEPNFNNLRYLVKFLSTLTKNQSRNKMTPANLAIVIAPNLLWSQNEYTFDITNITTSINSVVELLIKHADWFYKDNEEFFITFSKEDYLPLEQCDYGFTNNFGPGNNQTAALNQENSNGEFVSMSKSMHDGGQVKYKNVNEGLGRHSRSNSHDTSLILLESDMKKAQSNSSLSDQSSPPHGSPKPTTRRKNKPLAPVPPNFTPDKTKTNDNQVEPLTKMENEKPAKPPRPVISDTGKIISGVQTINRSTYKQNKLKDDTNKCGSRENLFEIRRQSLELEKEKIDLRSEQKNDRESTLVVKNTSAQSGVVARMKVSDPVCIVGNKARPVAAPRTILPTTDDGDVVLRCKPAVPERPAALRPHSFRGGRGSQSDTDQVPTQLERAHVYSVDKQHPTVIQVGSDESRVTVQRTHSSGGRDEEPRALSRQLSHSEGSITEAEPRPRPPRPQVPPPPTPSIAHESTDL